MSLPVEHRLFPSELAEKLDEISVIEMIEAVHPVHSAAFQAQFINQHFLPRSEVRTAAPKVVGAYQKKAPPPANDNDGDVVV